MSQNINNAGRQQQQQQQPYNPSSSTTSQQQYPSSSSSSSSAADARNPFEDPIIASPKPQRTAVVSEIGGRYQGLPTDSPSSSPRPFGHHNRNSESISSIAPLNPSSNAMPTQPSSTSSSLGAYPQANERSQQQSVITRTGSGETSSSGSVNGQARLLGGEEGGVQRGELGGNYGPYAYQSTALPSAHSQEPLLARQGPQVPLVPHVNRFSSNISEASYDSYIKPATVGTASPGGGGGRGQKNSAAMPANQRTQVQGNTSMLLWDNKEDMDDALHTPDPKGRDRDEFNFFSGRGWINVMTVVVLIGALITLFAGYPIISYYTGAFKSNGAATPGFNLGGINGSGQVPDVGNFPKLIDPDTPSSVYTRTGFDGKDYQLVFSDEFEKDGRTFYEGDDPYWEAVDLHYWPTGDFEWYDPGAVTTANGKLVVSMTEEPIHDLNFKSGMLQSWNKLCFSQSAYIEVSVSLPGNNQVGGFWPGVWTMGNLGRPGYGASTDGTWPYSYDSCDIGTLPNQTNTAGTGPTAALTTGANGGTLSYLPGQRWSACTCQGEDHPGPNTGVGRGVPEIDILEAQVNIADAVGVVSQSAQFAPYDDYYQFNNASTAVTQYNTAITGYNSYLGGLYQQAVSSLTNIPSANYAGTSGAFGVYGFEYYGNPADRDNGYITWVASGTKSWTMHAAAVGPNSRTEIGQRLVAEEPMAMVINFGMSNNFQSVDFEGLTFPNYMYVEYVRVYQRTDFGSIGCDPASYPTAAYIAKHPSVYANANLTTWESAGYTFPKNSLKDTC